MSAPAFKSRRLDASQFTVVLLVAGITLLWGLAAAQWHPLPQTDSLEQLLFAQDWRLAYAKHPPLPTWILRAVATVTGPSVGLTFILGAASSALAIAVLYLWARPLVGGERAALAALLCSLIVYYNAMTSFYNHNTVQLPFSIAAIALFHAALARQRWRDWLAFGVAAGLLLMVKLTALLLLASLALFVLYLAAVRWPMRLRLWLQMGAAGLLALALAGAPLAALYGSGDAAGRYVGAAVAGVAGVGARLSVAWSFLGSVMACVLPAVLAFVWLRRRAPAAVPVNAAQADPPVPLGAFLAIVGFGPLLLTLAFALFAGANLLSPWGTPLFTTFTLWLVAASRWRIGADASMLARAGIVALALHGLLFAVLVSNQGRLPNLGKRYTHVPIATPALADAVAQAWRQHSAAPLPMVAANIRSGAPLALGFRGTPYVVDGNRWDIERVAPLEQRRRCGMVYVSGPIGGAPPPSSSAGRLQTVAFERTAQPVLDSIDDVARTVATWPGSRSTVVAAPNRDGGTNRYWVIMQLPEPPDGSACPRASR